MNGSADERKRKILISGYYGFDNLGDEAILEQIISELSRLTSKDNIVVLSANPESTSSRYKVKAIARGDFAALFKELSEARLFVSGGGGLFQNTKSLGSILFYGLQIAAARSAGVPVLIYAQGIGPLNGPSANLLTKQFFSLSTQITVRDNGSENLCKSWGLKAGKTADPVWNLSGSPLPPEVERLFAKDASNVAISLRPHATFSEEHSRALAKILAQTLPEPTNFLLVSLQEAQDRPVLERFRTFLQENNRDARFVNSALLPLPSTWLSFFARADMTVAMRLHALVMALSAGRPVAGLAYDPKVTAVCQEFEQPILILTKDFRHADWEETLKTLTDKRARLEEASTTHAQIAKNSACQNFEVLATMLDMHRGSSRKSPGTSQ